MSDVYARIARSSGAVAYTILAGTVILVITARWLGPEGRGEIAGVMTWVGLFSTLGYFSLGHVAIHRATTLRGSPWLGPTFGSLVLLTGVVTCAGWGGVIGRHALRGVGGEGTWR